MQATQACDMWDNGNTPISPTALRPTPLPPLGEMCDTSSTVERPPSSESGTFSSTGMTTYHLKQSMMVVLINTDVEARLRQAALGAV